MFKTILRKKFFSSSSSLFLNNKNIIDNNIFNELIKCKNKINLEKYFKSWDNAKKYSNIYELIYIPNKINRKNSISKYKPLSRSYFKWEIIYDFNLLNDASNKIYYVWQKVLVVLWNQ